MTTLTVTLADDEPLVLQGLRLVLEMGTDLHIAAEATDGVAALATIREHRPSVALVDLAMPRMDGTEVVRRVRADPSLATTRLLVLTTFADDATLAGAVRAGADGYLLKSMAPEAIRGAVRACARGETTLAPMLVDRLLAEHAGRTTARDPVLDRLTVRETAVLRQVARGRSNAEIAAALFVSEGTVKTHVASLLAKLRVRDRTQATVAAYELGLIVAGDADCTPGDQRDVT